MQLMSFESTAQRVLYRYLFSFADFSPIESAAGVDAQKAFYAICKPIVQSVAGKPEWLGLPTALPDQWLGAHETLNMYPELYKVRSDCQKTFVDLACFLFCAGQMGHCEDERLVVKKTDLPKTNAKRLGMYKELFGHSGILMTDGGDVLLFQIPSSPDALSAWKVRAALCAEKKAHPREQALLFMLWIYEHDDSCFLERIRVLLGLEEDFFHKVAKAYRQKGYDVAFKIDEYKTSVTYSKNISGLSIEFATLWPTVRFVNRSCIGIKAILENAAECDGEFVRQLVQFCRPCTDCMGCTKGGKNRQFTVGIQIDHNEHRVCPEFVQMEWYNGDISMDKIEFLLALNELQEKYGKKQQK